MLSSDSTKFTNRFILPLSLAPRYTPLKIPAIVWDSLKHHYEQERWGELTKMNSRTIKVGYLLRAFLHCDCYPNRYDQVHDHLAAMSAIIEVQFSKEMGNITEVACNDCSFSWHNTSSTTGCAILESEQLPQSDVVIEITSSYPYPKSVLLSVRHR